MIKKTNIPELDKLFEDVGTYRSSKNYKEVLEFIKRFRNIAPYNAMLIHIQKPGSKYVASVSDWWKKFKRKPKPGARPLVILRPFGPVAFVYELSDTEGEAFPEEIEKPFEAHGKISKSTLDKFIGNAYLNGYRIIEHNYGTNLAGYVSVLNEKGH